MENIELKIVNLQIGLYKSCGTLLIISLISFMSLDFYFGEIELFYYTVIEFLIVFSSQIIISKIYQTFNTNFKKLTRSFCYIYMCFIACSIAYVKHPYEICWFFIGPMLFMFCFSFKKSIFLTIGMIFLIFFLIYVIKITNFPMPEKVSQNIIFFKLFSINTIICTFTIFFTMTYYFSEITKYEQILLNIKRVTEQKNGYKEERNKKQLEFLFKKIEKHLKTNKPWLDSNYTLKQLAKEVNSNTLYVSRCIQLTEKKKFNTYIHDYRMAYFIQKKKDLKTPEDIENLYIASGFSKKRKQFF